jgi:hypothetical protein
VPQGSVLGPLLFNVFINDMVDCFNVEYLLYADDLKLFCNVDTIDDSIKLQTNINSLLLWCSKNGLDINIDKCNIVSYTRNQVPYLFEYNLSSVLIKRTKNVKDLGVYFDSQVSFSYHIEYVVSKAYKMLGFVLRNGKFLNDPESLRILYCAYVRSHMEYAAVVWSPIYNVYVEMIENIQRKFCKAATYLTEGYYPVRGCSQILLLKKFNLISLKQRRCCSFVMYMYKLIHGQIDCADLLRNVNFRVPRLTSRVRDTFLLPYARTNKLIASPIFQMKENCNKFCKTMDIFACKPRDIAKLIFNAVE